MCLLVSIRLMTTGFKVEGVGAVVLVLPSLALFISFLILIAPETAFRLAEWCAKPFADLFFPSEEFSKPALSYTLARRYAQDGRLDDAMLEYEKILYYYPDERTAYKELLELTRRMGDENAHQKYAAAFKKRFGEELPEDDASVSG